MMLQNFLEDFGKSQTPAANDLPEDDGALANIKLEAFESGYKAGWDDAVAAKKNDADAISTEFSQNLLDLSFTYHEAQAYALNAFKPLVQSIVEQMLPRLGRATLIPMVLDQLFSVVKDCANQPVLITVNPQNLSSLETLLDRDFGFPVTVSGDQTLSETEASIAFASSEVSVDLSDLLTEFTEALEAIYTGHEEIAAHG